MLIYTPLAVAHYIRTDTSPITAVLLYVRGLIFVGEQYNNWILWYLLSAIYALLVLGLISRVGSGLTRNKLVGMVIVASILCTACSFLSNYEGRLSGIVEIVQMGIKYVAPAGRIFRGMVFIPIGILLSDGTKETRKLYLWIMLIVGIVGKVIVTNPFTDLAFLLMSSIGVFGLILQIKLKDRTCYLAFRNMSLTVYLIHLYIWTAYYMIVYGKVAYGLDSFVVTTVVCLLISFLYWIWKTTKRRHKHLTKWTSPTSTTA